MELTGIYKQFHQELLGYLKSKIRSKEDAEDILQNVFIKVSSNVDKLEEKIKLKSWLFTITRNAVIDYYRVNAKKRTVSGEIDEDVFASDEPDHTKGLDQCMSSMINLLPDEYRDIIIDSEIKEIKQKDLASKYGMPYPSMRSRIQRGRERLKQLFYNCCHIETDQLGNVLHAQGRTDANGSCKPCSSNNN
jgi:RNA polymerase sigma-70 factor (ECF subfamily)